MYVCTTVREYCSSDAKQGLFSSATYLSVCKCFFPSGRRVYCAGSLLLEAWNRYFRDELLWRNSWRAGRPDMQGDPGRLGGVLVAYVR